MLLIIAYGSNQKLPNNMTLFILINRSDTESDAGSTFGTFGEMRPRLNSYEQKERLGKEAVSYEAGSENIHFKLKPNSLTPLEPDDAV